MKAPITSGCSKRPSSKAAASEEARRTLRYVEPLNDARTMLAVFFSILLTRRPGHVSPAQDMEMKVKHALPAMCTGIDDKSVPGIGNSL